MFKEHLVSIIMPAYNCEAFIKESIESVMAQTYTHWELIIVNDCSTDNTLAVVTEFSDPRVTLINNEVNLGVANSRNIAIEKAEGRFIAFLDSDDLWYSTKLEKQVIALCKAGENTVCSHSSYERIDEFGSVLTRVSIKNSVKFKTLLKSNFIGNLTGIIDRSKVVLPKQKEVKHEDYVMWLEILSSGQDFYSLGVPEVLAKYRVRAGSISANKLKSLTWHWHILRYHMRLNIFQSSLFILNYLYFASRKRA